MNKLVAVVVVLFAYSMVQRKAQYPHGFNLAGDVNTISPDLGVGGDDDLDDGTDCDDDEFMLALA